MQRSHAARQNERRRVFYEKYAERMFDAIDDHGVWRRGEPSANFREKLWHCLPLLYLGGRFAERANRIIAAIEPQYCHFSPMTALQLVLKHEDRLSAAARDKLIDYVQGSLPGAAEDRIRFPMYNDNFAALAAFTLLIAGERFGLADAFAAGKNKLLQLKDVLTRRGTIMEFGSPTYTPITTHILAEIVNYVQDEETREIAARCETRMWAEIAARCHPPTGQFAGPYSRAYLVDSVCHPHNIHGLLDLAFGDLPVKPADVFFPARPEQVVHIGEESLMLPNLAWLYSGDVHCPDPVAELLLAKRFPFDAILTAECLPGEEVVYSGEAVELPAWSGPNVIHMTQHYALGTSAGQFYDGAISDSFHIVYRARRECADWTGTRSVFCRYFTGERRPGEANEYNGKTYGPEMLRDEGRKFSLQHRSAALVAYRPKPYEAKRTESMKLSVLFPVHFRDVESVWIGDRPAAACGFSSVEPVPVYVQDGPVYFCFCPLNVTDAGRRAAVKVERSGAYLLISFYNYEGPVRSFDPREAALLSNGFIAHLGSEEEDGSFEAFRRRAASGVLQDTMRSQLGGYTRVIRYKHPDVAFDFAFSPRSEGILHAVINGRPRPEPRFSASGFDSGSLPFLAGSGE